MLNELKNIAQMKKEDAIKVLVEAKRYYSELYERGESPLTDKDYDQYVIEQLKEFDPMNTVLKEVGAKNAHLEEFRLPASCGSLCNVKAGQVAPWIATVGRDEEYIASQKLDGLSVLLEYRDGELYKAYTRGNGIFGHDITQHVKHMPTVPRFEAEDRDWSWSDENSKLIRAEAVMKERTFIEKYKGSAERAGYKTSRNMIAGILGRIASDPKILADIDIVCYEVKGEELSKEQQFLQLQDLGFKVAIYTKVRNLDDETAQELLEMQREYSNYLMDGLVIEVNDVKRRAALGLETNSLNPAYARSFKPTAEQYQAEVEYVQWNTSKNGLVKPRVKLKTTNIKGVDVNWSAGKNVRRIEDYQIGPGAILNITRSGDTIPDILGTIKGTTPQIPTHCPACGARLGRTASEADLICLNKDCEGRNFKRLLTFFRSIEVEGFNYGTAQKFVDAGYSNISKALRITLQELKALEGFQDRSATKLYDNLQKALEGVHLSTLMHSTGYFGRSLGATKLERILESFGQEKTLELATLDREDIISKICSLKGFSRNTAELFASGVREFVIWYETNKDLFKMQEDKQEEVIKAKSSKLQGEVFLFTGFRDAELEKKIVENGGEIAGAMNKTVTCLVAKDPSKNSGKLKKARELGVKIITRTEVNL